MTSVLAEGDLGNISLGILYCSVCVFVFVASAVVERWNEKWTMVLGAFCYVAYMTSLIHVVRIVVCIASVVIGEPLGGGFFFFHLCVFEAS